MPNITWFPKFEVLRQWGDMLDEIVRVLPVWHTVVWVVVSMQEVQVAFTLVLSC